MRPSRFSRLTTFALLAALAPPVAAQTTDEPVQGGATFLLVPVGARATALGQASVADGGSAESAFWNPAGLARLSRSEFALHHANTFASANTALSGYFALSQLGVFGATAYLVDFGSQEVVPGPGAPVGRIGLKNLELLASYATSLTEAIAFGINYKLIQFRQECSGDCGPIRTEIGTTHAVDVGVQYVVGTNDKLRLGLALQHAGFKLQVKNREQADPLPTRIQLGAVYRIELPAPPDVPQGLDARLLVDVQSAYDAYDDPDARVGIDVGVGDLVRLRTGYAFLRSESRGPSVGLGVRVGRIYLDFAQVFFVSSSFDEPVYISLRVAL